MARHDDYPVGVPHDHIARVNSHAAAADRHVVLDRVVTRKIERRSRPGAIHRKIHARDFVAVAQTPVGDQSRSAAHLQACIAEIDAPSAYRDKWLVEGITAPPAGAQPMRNVALTDEIFHQYWCRRELDVQRDPGYLIVSYHAEPRFGAVLESDAIESFRTGRDIGVLVTNRYVDAGRKPAVEFLTRRGRRIIYVQPSALAEVDAQASVPVVLQTSAR